MRLLGGESPSLEMPARLQEDMLIVELGSPSLGPTLCLTYAGENATPLLIPEVKMGLYDDWEENFGVPWVFPLSVFRPLTA